MIWNWNKAITFAFLWFSVGLGFGIFYNRLWIVFPMIVTGYSFILFCGKHTMIEKYHVEW